jgi:hypothetical protein
MSPTDDCTTLGSCEEINPMPAPSNVIPMANGDRSICGSTWVKITMIAASSTSNPTRTTRRGRCGRRTSLRAWP